MNFTMSQKILFRHCDPAGIVFYPRYVEMMNDCVETFFDKSIGFPFSQIHKDGGIPTAELSIQFKAVSRLGDQLKIHLTCRRLGRTSLSLETRAMCDKELRFTARSTLVFVDKTGKPSPWPTPIRNKIELYVKESAA